MLDLGQQCVHHLFQLIDYHCGHQLDTGVTEANQFETLVELGFTSLGISTNKASSIASKGMSSPLSTPWVKICKASPVNSHVLLKKIGWLPSDPGAFNDLISFKALRVQPMSTPSQVFFELPLSFVQNFLS